VHGQTFRIQYWLFMVKETYNVCGVDGKVVRIVLSVVDDDEVGKGLKFGIECRLHSKK
jgi:hypothetical protein